MTLHEISPLHHEAIERIRARYGHDSSSHAFISLLHWQEEMGLSLYIQKDMFAVKCESRGDNCWFFPCGEEKAVAEFIAELLGNKAPLRLRYMRKEDVEMLRHHFPHRFAIMDAPQDSEYIYDKAEQLAMLGSNFRHQRNSINRVKQKYRLETKQICGENMAEIAPIWEDIRDKSIKNAFAIATLKPERMMLHNWEKLGMSGILIYADGAPAAIAAGFMLSDEIYDISICRQALDDADIIIIKWFQERL